MREDLTMASIAAAKGQVQALCDAIRDAYGVELPRRPQRVAGQGIAFIWAGPDQWLAVADRADGRDLERELKTRLAGLAAVVDQSDGRVVVRVAGPMARKVLVKGVPIDLHPRAFGVNSAAITHASHIGIIIWQLDDIPTFEMALFRSYADSFTHWLLDSARSTVPGVV
ncbi:MAG: sarcosine oxidase subunit gamma family protein [Hyphomicrobium sp.]